MCVLYWLCLFVIILSHVQNVDYIILFYVIFFFFNVSGQPEIYPILFLGSVRGVKETASKGGGAPPPKVYKSLLY